MLSRKNTKKIIEGLQEPTWKMPMPSIPCLHPSVVSSDGHTGFCPDCGDSARVKEVSKCCGVKVVKEEDDSGGYMLVCPACFNPNPFEPKMEECHLNYSSHICNENHCSEIDCLKCKGLEETELEARERLKAPPFDEPEGWEKEFDKYYAYAMGVSGPLRVKALKDFIRQAISKAREEAREEHYEEFNETFRQMEIDTRQSGYTHGYADGAKINQDTYEGG